MEEVLAGAVEFGDGVVVGVGHHADDALVLFADGAEELLGVLDSGYRPHEPPSLSLLLVASDHPPALDVDQDTDENGVE